MFGANCAKKTKLNPNDGPKISEHKQKKRALLTNYWFEADLTAAMLHGEQEEERFPALKTNLFFRKILRKILRKKLCFFN